MENAHKIIHVDMDAFFASVEQRDFPELKGKPVAVGGGSQRGVVAAASYEARKFGVFSAMPSAIAKRKCPDLIFAKPRFAVYRSVSEQIREIFHSYTDLVEPLSLDEAYLDVTENKKGIELAVTLAKEIKSEILKTTGLTASAGVSYNKFLAKIASAIQKPDGLTLIHPERAQEFINKLPIEKFHGIGKVTAQKMKALGIFTGGDLRNKDLILLTKHFGKSGKYYFNIARGIDERIVNPNRIRKSIGSESTFHHDLYTYRELLTALSEIAQKSQRWIEERNVAARTLTIKIKFNDFEIVTRSRTRLQAIQSKDEVIKIVEELLLEFNPPPKGVRLLGFSLSNFIEEGAQLWLNFP